MYVTFEVPLDRGPYAWARYTFDTVQLGPFETEAHAWQSLAATVGGERADISRIVGVERELPGGTWVSSVYSS